MKIAITGSNGFIGSALVSHFTKKGDDIVKIDRNSLKQSDLYVKFNKCDVVIHTAGKAHIDENQLDSIEYDEVNFKLACHVFDSFLLSSASTFIHFSSIQSLGNHSSDIITESTVPIPGNAYGKSKLKADQYILSKIGNQSRHVYIFLPTLVYGKNPKGNLNKLINFLNNYRFWPLGSFNSNRSYCSLNTITSSIDYFIRNNSVNSGVYIVSDDNPISLNELVKLISIGLSKKVLIFNLPKNFIYFIVNMGNIFRLGFDSVLFNKIISPYEVSNAKLKSVLPKDFQFDTRRELPNIFK